MWHALGHGECDLWEEVWEQTSISLTGSGDIFQLPGAGTEFQALTEISVPLFSVPLSMSRKLGIQIETEKSDVNLKKLEDLKYVKCKIRAMAYYHWSLSG